MPAGTLAVLTSRPVFGSLSADGTIRDVFMEFRALRIGLMAGLLAVMVAAASLPQHAAAGSDCKRSQDCALEAFRSGEIKPLTEVLALARARVPGEVVKVELDREDGLWVYEIKILTPSGKRRKVEIDARTLDVIKVD